MTDRAMRVSPLEYERFGIVTARSEIASLAECDRLEDFCRSRDVELTVVRVPTHKLEVIHELESRGFSLTDTLLYFRRDLAQSPIPRCTKDGNTVRTLRIGEAEAVRSIARDAFRGYLSHYHADPRLPQAACDELYADWAYRGCTDRSTADCVLVAERNHEIAGFGLVRVRDDEAEGTLYGVAPWARGCGLYAALVTSAMRWARARGCRTLIESTQVTNLASQKVWSRLGFEPSRSFYTLHRWSIPHSESRVEV